MTLFTLLLRRSRLLLFLFVGLILASLMLVNSPLAQTSERRLLNPNAVAGFVAVDPPLVSDLAIERGGVIATIPLAYARSGTLKSDVVSSDGRINAGTILHAFRFVARSGQDEITVWCGLGSRNAQKMPRVAETSCLALTRDGRARITYPAQPYEYPFNSNNIVPLGLGDADSSKNEPASVIDRPMIEALPRVKSELSFVVQLGAISKDTVYVRTSLVGPRARNISRTTEYISVDLIDNVATFVLGTTRISLIVSGETVTASKAAIPVPPLGQAVEADASPINVIASTPDLIKPPIPQPFVIQGMSLSPSSLVPATQPVAIGGSLATGPSAWWRTGTLSAPIKGNAGGGNIDEQAGVRFYQVEFFTPGPLLTRSMSLVWCSNVGKTVWGTRQNMAYCFAQIGDGIVLTHSSLGQDFAADLRNLLPSSVLAFPNVQIVQDPQAVSPPFDISIKLRGVKRDSFDLDFVVSDGKRSQSLLRLDLPRPANGDPARLPLWTHVLELSVAETQQTVAVKLSQENVDAGPVDVRMEAGQQISPWTGRLR